MRIKVYKSDSNTPDHELSGKMVVIEAAEGIPLALLREVGPGQYAITDTRDPNFELALKYFGVPYQIQVFKERINVDQPTEGQILVPGSSQKPLIFGG